MPIIIIISIALIGMCIGSFINVIVYRFSAHNLTLSFVYDITFPRSRCPSCLTPLGNWQLIPVISWLVLRGHCYYCQTTISIRYLCIELLCSVLFTWIAIQHGLSDKTLLLLLLTSWFILLSLIDIDHYLLPDSLTLSLLWCGLLISYLSFGELRLEEAFLGCVYGFLLLWLPAIIFKYIKGYAGLGGGDIKLLAALGAWIHYSQLPLLLIIASCLGIIYILSYRVFKKTKIAKIAFGPFILFGGWLLLIYN